MFENIQKILNRIGLKDTEIKVYLVCLENKQGLFVAEIAKETDIKRSTVNLILERLNEKGFVTYHLDGNRKLFSAESPEALLFHLEESVTDLRGLIPLLRITSGIDKQTKIRFFEGKEGVEKIYTDILLTLKINKDPKKEQLAISSGEDVFEITPEHQKQFINKRVRERIPIRWIAPEGKISRELDKTSSKEFRKMKFFDSKKYQFHIEIDVYSNKIALISLSKEHTGIIVENKALAESFRSLFNLLWDSIK
ncbi:MAG: helix-turn-helix domain-containing protein [bacterium]|nr:helix-turn-helix domain-containing protein [bacterium]